MEQPGKRLQPAEDGINRERGQLFHVKERFCQSCFKTYPNKYNQNRQGKQFLYINLTLFNGANDC